MKYVPKTEDFEVPRLSYVLIRDSLGESLKVVGLLMPQASPGCAAVPTGSADKSPFWTSFSHQQNTWN